MTFAERCRRASGPTPNHDWHVHKISATGADSFLVDKRDHRRVHAEERAARPRRAVTPIAR